MIDKWNYTREYKYGDDTTYKKIGLLSGAIEDWGCGTCYAKKFTKEKYTGIDGSGKFCDTKIDLIDFKSEVDNIFMRHILEHNVEWKKILKNAINSFRKEMILILFIPTREKTEILKCDKNNIPDLALSKGDLMEILKPYLVKEEELKTKTIYGYEKVFYLKKYD